MDIRHVKVLVNEVLGHAAVLALATVAAWAASHGWHFHVPAFPAGITATALWAIARVALKGLVKAIRSGKLEAELVADIKRYGPTFLEDVAKQAEKSA